MELPKFIAAQSAVFAPASAMRLGCSAVFSAANDPDLYGYTPLKISMFDDFVSAALEAEAAYRRGEKSPNVLPARVYSGLKAKTIWKYFTEYAKTTGYQKDGSDGFESISIEAYKPIINVDPKNQFELTVTGSSVTYAFYRGQLYTALLTQVSKRTQNRFITVDGECTPLASFVDASKFGMPDNWYKQIEYARLFQGNRQSGRNDLHLPLASVETELAGLTVLMRYGASFADDTISVSGDSEEVLYAAACVSRTIPCLFGDLDLKQEQRDLIMQGLLPDGTPRKTSIVVTAAIIAAVLVLVYFVFFTKAGAAVTDRIYDMLPEPIKRIVAPLLRLNRYRAFESEVYDAGNQSNLYPELKEVWPDMENSLFDIEGYATGIPFKDLKFREKGGPIVRYGKVEFFLHSVDRISDPTGRSIEAKNLAGYDVLVRCYHV